MCQCPQLRLWEGGPEPLQAGTVEGQARLCREVLDPCKRALWRGRPGSAGRSWTPASGRCGQADWAVRGGPGLLQAGTSDRQAGLCREALNPCKRALWMGRLGCVGRPWTPASGRCGRAAGLCRGGPGPLQAGAVEGQAGLCREALNPCKWVLWMGRLGCVGRSWTPASGRCGRAGRAVQGGPGPLQAGSVDGQAGLCREALNPCKRALWRGRLGCAGEALDPCKRVL
ncbi:hypothetical protein P7K49_026074 [Saguinus oedipus]|uniref:Uncharacterized protein n=1 Tax=Saguinus oedipus TaxID=9490 RepID=A0ABQ9UIZ3_SAGOE|nr:hypothetical protein P7K49_026074 [Saguinus oedipus]